MSMSPAIAPPELTGPSAAPVTFRGLGLMAWVGLFAALALGLIGLGLVLAQQAPQAVRAGMNYADAGWMTIGLAAAVAGGLASLLAARAAGADQQLACTACIGLALMAGCSALAVRAIELIAVVRYPLALNEPVVVRINVPGGGAAGAAAVPAATEAVGTPDAAHGATLFGNSCAACHGGAGEGVDGIALALAATPWMIEQSDDALVAFLKVGRAPAAADTKMGKAMPARGGNAALSDGDLADIVAHLRSLAAATATADATSPAKPAAALPPKWVIAAPPDAAGGLVAAELQPLWPEVAGSTRPAFNLADRDLFVRCLGALSALQAFHLAVLMLVLVGLLAESALRPPLEQAASLRRVAAGWFMLGGVAALVLAAWATPW